MNESHQSFIEEIKKYPLVDNFFSSFKYEEIFSEDCDVLHDCLERMRHIPKCIIEYNKEFDTTFLAKYLSISIPRTFNDLFLSDLFYFIDKLPNRDLNFTIQILASRLTGAQKAIAVFNFPDCLATFLFLSTLFDEDAFFISAFQRIFSSFSLVPFQCKPIINSRIRNSIKNGPARDYLPDIFSIVLNGYSKKKQQTSNNKNEINLSNFYYNNGNTNSNTYNSPLEIVLSALIDGFPSSTEYVDNEILDNIMKQMLLQSRLPMQSLIFMKQNKLYNFILSYQQIYHFIDICSDIFFDYLNTSPHQQNINEMWSLIMRNSSLVPMLYPHQDVIISIHKHFLLLTLSNPSQIFLIEQSNIEWFHQFINTMGGDPRELALFGLYLLLLRCFDIVGKQAVNDQNIYESFEKTLDRISNKRALVDIIFYALDPRRTCPFDKLIDFEVINELDFPPPSSSFVFTIVPLLLNAIMKISVFDSLPTEDVDDQNGFSLRSSQDLTHSKISLTIYEGKEEEEETETNNETESKTKEECSLSADESSKTQKVPSESAKTSTETKDKFNKDFKDINNSRSFIPNDFLKFVINNLSQMYLQDELVPFLYSISTSSNLISFIPFAENDEDCFIFFARAIGLSCPFIVFHTFFRKISQDFPKTIKFLSNIVENLQLVNDYIYVTYEIPMILTSSSNTVALWVRPLKTMSTLFTLYTTNSSNPNSNKNLNDFTVAISPNYIQVTEGKETPIPPKIGGWVFVTFTFSSSNTLIITCNLTTIKVVFPADIFPCSGFKIGSSDSHFDLQSVRVFRNTFTDDDLYYLFALGPNLNEFMVTDFNTTFSSSSQLYPPSFAPESGFISQLYLPYINYLSKRKKFETNILNSLESVLAPPFNSVRHIFSKTQSNREGLTISVDRRRSYSFMNSLHCHGGIYLIIHYIGEIILKHPSLNEMMFKFLSKLIDHYPSFNKFFEETRAYALVGHLMWSGNTPSKVTIDLAMQQCGKSFFLTNPEIIKHWLFEAQLYYSEMDDIVGNLMISLDNQRNFIILSKANTFEKIVNLLCGTCKHTEKFLYILSLFAFKLTTPETAEINARLVFDRLILCHFVFSLKELNEESKNETIEQTNQQQPKPKLHAISLNHSDIKPINTVYMIRILQMILTKYADLNVKVELEFFLAAIITSVPIVQAEIIGILFQQMKYNCLHFLSFVLKQLPFIQEITDTIFSKINEYGLNSFVRLTTCLTYLVSHEECKELVLKLCSNAKIEQYSLIGDEASIALNQVTEILAITEQSDVLLRSDEHKETYEFISFLIYQSFVLEKYDLVTLFFYSIYTIPKVPTYRLVSLIVFYMDKSMRIILELNQNQAQIQNIVDKIIENMANFVAFLVHKVRLTPGSINTQLLILFENYSTSLISLTKKAQSNDAASNLLVFLIALFHIELPQQFVKNISNMISDVPKLTKQKRYQEMIERMEEPSSITPTKFTAPFTVTLEQIAKRWESFSEVDRIGLFSLSCSSIHYKTFVSNLFQNNDPDSDFVIDLWHKVFLTLQFPGSYIYSQCPTKWMISDRSWNYQQRQILLPINPSIDKIYENFWTVKYGSNSPNNNNISNVNNNNHYKDNSNENHNDNDSNNKSGNNNNGNNEIDNNISKDDCNINDNKNEDNINIINSDNNENNNNNFPNIRLKLHEVLQYTPISLHNAKDVIFSSHATRLFGILNFDGVFIMTAKKIRFYQRSKDSSEFCEDFLTIPLSKIGSIKLKSIRHQPTGVEIICNDRNCYIFSFDTFNLRDLFIDSISAFNTIQIIKSLNMKEIDIMTRKWVDGLVSNFDYLLYLNTQSGRSWNDFTQYPIFPWIIKDYSSATIDFSDPNLYRDLTLPIFAQSMEQQEQCLSYYRTTSSLSGDGHCTPNYFSNVGSTLYFLVRLEPFCDEVIAFQGGSFDAADRTFQSFEISFSLMVAPGNKNALELVPEFYFSPEVLKNINEIKFPDSILSKRVVGDVILPPWAKSHREMIRKMRMALESKHVSQRLNEWIDLVWGFRRRGEAALEKFNVFQTTVFEFNFSEVIDDRILFKAMRDQIHNCGQAPQSIFKSPHPKRNINAIYQDCNENLPLPASATSLSSSSALLTSATLTSSMKKLVYKTCKKSAMQKKGLDFAFSTDGWMKVDPNKTNVDVGNVSAVKISQGSLNIFLLSNIIKTYSFLDDIAITCFDVMNSSILITGHAMPIVNIWKLREDVTLIHSLRCHLSRISFVKFFKDEWSLIAVGHEDGVVSLFSTNPMRFLRSLSNTECSTTAAAKTITKRTAYSYSTSSKVTLIRMSEISGDLLVCQHKQITLWTVNGEKIVSIKVKSEPIDAVFTNFTDGIKENYIFMLCENGSVLLIDAFELKLINEINISEIRAKPISLCFKVDTLYIQHADSAVTCWKFV